MKTAVRSVTLSAGERIAVLGQGTWHFAEARPVSPGSGVQLINLCLLRWRGRIPLAAAVCVSACSDSLRG